MAHRFSPSLVLVGWLSTVHIGVAAPIPSSYAFGSAQYAAHHALPRRCDLDDVQSPQGFRLGDCTELDLEDYDLTDDDVAQLALVLRESPNIRLVDLSNNKRITDEGAIALGKALARNDKLNTLELYGCSVGDAGVKALIESIESNARSSIAQMDLRGNPITTAAAHAHLQFSQEKGALLRATVRPLSGIDEAEPMASL
mmetsp:Transcript_30419/g.92921  ORF Transcript_30419/g.92921 Transcript_30419/m.92921 type:complete len:199 (-) Transcript_30419:330-926(-)